MRKFLIAVLLGMMATVSYAQTPPTTDQQVPPPGIKPKWVDKSKNSSGHIMRARVGESESKMQMVETSSPSELKVTEDVKMVELTIDYKGKALWIIKNEGIVSRSGLMDGVNTCILNVSGLSGTTIRIAVIGVLDNQPALLQEYMVIVGSKPNPPNVDPIKPPVVDPVKPPEIIVDPVDPPAPVVNTDLVDKLQDAADLDVTDKKISPEAVTALQRIYAEGSKQPKTSVATLYKWLTDQYNSDTNKSVLPGNAKNLRVVINSVLASEISPFAAQGTNVTDADWVKVRTTLANVANALGKIKLTTGLADATNAIFVSNKDTMSTDEANVRSSKVVRDWLNENKLKSQFLYLDNKYVKDKMGKIVEKYGTPSVMVVNDKGDYKAFKMPLTDADTIKALKEKTSK